VKPLHLVLVFALAPGLALAQPVKGSRFVSEYGALGDGASDDSAAFNACLSANTTCIVDPGKMFVIGNVKLNSGNRLMGNAMVEYGVDTAAKTKTRPILLAKAGASVMLDVSGVKDGAVISGLFLDCRADKTNGISSGSFQLSLDQVTVVGCNYGLGGEKVPYTAEAHISNATFGGNRTGIGNLVDSFVTSADFANNSGNGLYLGAGSNANIISNSRFEWNQGFGLEVYGETSGNVVSNCIFDRNAKAGLRLVGASGFALANSSFSRNGRNNVAPDENTQIYLSHARNISIVGGLSAAGRDDGGAGPMTPAYVFSFEGSDNRNVALTGVMTSGQVSADNPRGGFTQGLFEGRLPKEGFSAPGIGGDMERP